MAHYIANSSTYVEAYMVALQTAAKHAPSVIPILAVQGPIPYAFQATIKALGGHVVPHRLSFLDTLRRHKPNIATGLLGSYLRIDVAQIINNVRHMLDATVDTDYVLWTDPDVLFYHDIDSCSLPKPRYLSIGPDAMHFNADNCGVAYFNVSGFGEVHSDLVNWASNERSFDFMVADQDMIKGYFGSFLHQLPDTYNWKPYWGKPGEHSTVHWVKTARIVILHLHGPKLGLVMCVLERFRARVLGQWDARWWVQDADNRRWMDEQCGCKSAVVPCKSLYALVGMAYAQDRGALYEEVARTYHAYVVQSRQY